jgi:hypothetical protein
MRGCRCAVGARRDPDLKLTAVSRPISKPCGPYRSGQQWTRPDASVSAGAWSVEPGITRRAAGMCGGHATVDVPAVLLTALMPILDEIGEPSSASNSSTDTRDDRQGEPRHPASHDQFRVGVIIAPPCSASSPTSTALRVHGPNMDPLLWASGTFPISLLGLNGTPNDFTLSRFAFPTYATRFSKRSTQGCHATLAKQLPCFPRSPEYALRFTAFCEERLCLACSEDRCRLPGSPIADMPPVVRVPPHSNRNLNIVRS